MFRKGDRVSGVAGVFFRDRAAVGTVMGTREANDEIEGQTTLVRVALDDNDTAWVPASKLTRAGEWEHDA